MFTFRAPASRVPTHPHYLAIASVGTVTEARAGCKYRLLEEFCSGLENPRSSFLPRKLVFEFQVASHALEGTAVIGSHAKRDLCLKPWFRVYFQFGLVCLQVEALTQGQFQVYRWVSPFKLHVFLSRGQGRFLRCVRASCNGTPPAVYLAETVQELGDSFQEVLNM